MADIIDFRAKSKLSNTLSKLENTQEKLGKIILFSGVRFERDETANAELNINKSIGFLTSKSN